MSDKWKYRKGLHPSISLAHHCPLAVAHTACTLHAMPKSTAIGSAEVPPCVLSKLAFVPHLQKLPQLLESARTMLLAS